ncbi:MAG: Nre family DNA repair protein [Candidatus Micrarchaeia archaeon]
MSNPWVSEVIEDGKTLTELAGGFSSKQTYSNRCAVCKGSKLLCGKLQCPILVKLYAQMRVKPLINTLSIQGSSPPDIFIGRLGYPYVSIGPLIPPLIGDTSVMGMPEMWHDKTIQEIVNFRFQLVRGKHRADVKDVESGKIAELVRELALSKEPAHVEAEFKRKPAGRLILDDEVQPFGPSAPLKDMSLNYTSADHRIEKAFSDTDLKAADAVMELYEKNVLVSKIQRAFSAGLFGVEKKRRFVPTRWSITAVDSIISKNLCDEVKDFPVINEFRVYTHNALDNRWAVLMIPSNWSYELIEAWYPKTIWNPSGRTVAIFSDAEGFWGRNTYPDIGGCYFAARLAVTEHLKKERRQAAVVVMREAHPGYIMPVGVWNVREAVRNALQKQYNAFQSLDESLSYISGKFEIKIDEWIKTSKLLREILFQKRIKEYL